MTIKTIFAINHTVTITELETPGIVRRLQYDGFQITYLITYWVDSKLQEVWLNESEISPGES